MDSEDIVPSLHSSTGQHWSKFFPPIKSTEGENISPYKVFRKFLSYRSLARRASSLNLKGGRSSFAAPAWISDPFQKLPEGLWIHILEGAPQPWPFFMPHFTPMSQGRSVTLLHTLATNTRKCLICLRTLGLAFGLPHLECQSTHLPSFPQLPEWIPDSE